jgi:outer membrane protein TolC
VKGRAGNSETQILSIGASWEVDLWGRIRAESRSAASQYAATQDDYLWAQRVIAATTAKAWFSLIRYTVLEDRLRQSATIQEELVRIVGQRVTIGIAPETDLLEARNTLHAQRDGIEKAALARSQAAQALELLLGRYPAGDIATVPTLPAMPPAPNASLPASVVERRPDLTAAAHRVAAAFDMRQSAEAARLPRISISAAVTGIRSDVFLLNQAGSPVKGLNGAFFAPIFMGGELKARGLLHGRAEGGTDRLWQQCAAGAGRGRNRVTGRVWLCRTHQATPRARERASGAGAARGNTRDDRRVGHTESAAAAADAGGGRDGSRECGSRSP